MEIKTDILIIGGGSAGFGAAYRALEKGKRVVIAEKYGILGGTSTIGGVNNWEPGVSGNGVHFRLAERLMESGEGFVGRTVSFCKAGQPYAISDRSEDGYETTLRRFGVSEENQRRFQFEPSAMAREMKNLLFEKGGSRLTMLMNTSFISFEMSGGRIVSARLESSNERYIVHPYIVLDCTGSIAAARSAGCANDIGENARSDYGESRAPEKRSSRINSITKCFILERNAASMPMKFPADRIREEYKNVQGTVSCFYVCPKPSMLKCAAGNDPLSRIVGSDARISVNMLPTLQGSAIVDYSNEELEEICTARIFAYRNWLEDNCGLKDWKISHIFPLTGIREDYRLIGRYVLNNEDQLNGFAESLGKNHTIAYADHPTDIHGAGGCLKQTGLYGIPYECMLPVEVDNLIIACRGASFSHIAASSARLSRTMMAIGEAAGNAAALCVSEDIFPRDIPEDSIKLLMPVRM